MTPRTASVAPRGLGHVPRSAGVLFAVLARVRHGRLEVTGPGGRGFSFPGALPGPDAFVHLLDWDVCTEVLRRGDIGFAEAYLRGRWHTPDLCAVLTLAAMNQAAVREVVYGRWWGRLAYRLRHVLRANRRAGSRRNIHAHYDLGNPFYARWLDSTMTYSSGLFEGDLTRTLEQAQVAKYERILRTLNPQRDARLLEIGCGWGGFAEYAARTRGCCVHAITVSKRQLQFAQERIHAAQLDDRVTIEFCDYRDARGTFDFVVSIEMYEAVGERFWPAYFRVVRDRLQPGGRAVLQAIVIADALFPNYRRGTDFIQQFIFPGGMLASPTVFRRKAEQAGLRVRSTHAFGGDYAVTLQRWTRRFNSAWPQLQAMGFDARFKRLWSFYLAYCEAGFRSGNTDVMQMELGRA